MSASTTTLREEKLLLLVDSLAGREPTDDIVTMLLIFHLIVQFAPMETWRHIVAVMG